MTVATFEVTTLGTDELSVTWSLNSQAPAVFRVPVDTLGREVVVQANELPKLLKLLDPGALNNHWQVYVEVPPLNEVVVFSVVLPPLLTDVETALMTGADNAGLTVTRSADEASVVIGEFALSVTMTQ